MNPFRHLNAEQEEAHMRAAAARNPHRHRIDAIRAEMKVLSTELGTLMTEEEKGSSLLLWLTKAEESREQVQSLDNQALCVLAIETIGANLRWGEIEEACFDAMLERLGYEYTD